MSGHISIKYNLKGPNSSPVTACATGTHAIGDSFTIIKNNKADLMVCGGAEAAICPLGISGFSAARALCDLSLDNRKPLKIEGHLSRDPRAKERRKYGLKKARKAPQFSKR